MTYFEVSTRQLRKCLELLNRNANTWDESNAVQLAMKNNQLVLFTIQNDVQTFHHLDLVSSSREFPTICIGINQIWRFVRMVRDETVRFKLDQKHDDIHIAVKDYARLKAVHIKSDSTPMLRNKAIVTKLFSASEYRKFCQQLLPFTSTELFRYYLHGVLWDLSGSPEASFVATDGHRLVKIDHKTQEKLEANVSPIIPRELLHQARLACGNNDVTLEFDGKLITLTTGDCSYSAMPIDGTYPTYKKILPTNEERPFSLHINRAELLRASELCLGLHSATVSIFSYPNGKVGCEVLEFDDIGHAYGQKKCQLFLELTAKWPESATLDCIKLNPRYLHEFASTLEGQTVELRFCEQSAPRDRLPSSGGSLLVLDTNTNISRVLMPKRG
ncbi:hypothetical protein [Maritalea sp.]|uniref:DNA polymerase III subunit beta family protein n=1 Tax=Maritalea sp. TaxID=2003361 RepID=UPI003EFAB211